MVTSKTVVIKEEKSYILIVYYNYIYLLSVKENVTNGERGVHKEKECTMATKRLQNQITLQQFTLNK